MDNGFILFGDTYQIGEKTAGVEEIESDAICLVRALFRANGAVDVIYVHRLKLSCNGAPICAGSLMRNSKMSDVAQALIGRVLLTTPASS